MTSLLFLPFALNFWVLIILLFAAGLAATAAPLWADDVLVRARTRLGKRGLTALWRAGGILTKIG